MITELYIKNIAIIEETSVTFGRGLNILSGETGAGKSILIDSINFVLGSRSSRELIRTGAEEASVSAMFVVENSENLNKLNEMGIDISEEGELLLFRSMNTGGRNVCRINGHAAPLSMLRDAASLLIDIYGQHQSKSLLDPKRHMGLLDRFCGEELKAALAENEAKYNEYRKNMRLLKEQNVLGKDRETAVDILTYQINEIKAANIKIGEEEALKEKRDFLFNAARIRELSNSAVNSLYRSENSAYEKIGTALNSLLSLSRLDESVKESINDLEEINDKLRAVAEAVGDIAEKAESGETGLEEAERRLDLIKTVTAKYGGNEEECIKFLEEAENKLEALTASAERAEKLSEEIKHQKRSILKTCIKISEIRRKYAESIEAEIENNLHELGMEDAEFEIRVTGRKTFDKLGMDDVEFFIKTNKGDELKPLAKIASGGEMSRVMLSVKAVLSACDDVETFIFDEIDTGISGRTAQMSAVKMSELGCERQILCITHLSQICAAGDINFCIEKTTDETGTRTEVHRLTEDEVISEISRLNGGAVITDATLKAAAEMRRQAVDLKSRN